MSYWAEFARAGVPGTGRAGELPRWPAWGGAGKDAPTFVVLDTPADGGMRLSSDVMTKPRVIAEIEADPRMPTAAAKCERFRELAALALLAPDEYARLATCREYPLAFR